LNNLQRILDYPRSNTNSTFIPIPEYLIGYKQKAMNEIGTEIVKND
jgi:hypothetical protein